MVISNMNFELVSHPTWNIQKSSLIHLRQEIVLQVGALLFSWYHYDLLSHRMNSRNLEGADVDSQRILEDLLTKR